MGKSFKYELSWLDGQEKAVKSALNADWLVIAPEGATATVKVGNRDLSRARTAMYFAADVYRFDRYGHPATDYVNDFHVYKSANGLDYCEEAGVCRQEDGWHLLSLALQGGKPVFIVGDRLDPINHSEEIMARMKAKNVTWPKIQAAMDREIKRANEEARRIARHEWGQYYGRTFQIWIAHIRPLAEKVVLMLREKDDEKAALMQATAIQDARVRKEFYRLTKDLPRPAAEEETGDDVDLSGSGDSESAKPAPITFPTVKGNKLTGNSLNVRDLPVGTLVSFLKKEGSRLVDTRKPINWDGDNDLVVDAFEKAAAAGFVIEL